MPPVSQDVAAFCDSIGPAVQSYAKARADQAVAEATKTAADDQAKAVQDALAQVEQDHADEIAALKDALGKATSSTSSVG